MPADKPIAFREDGRPIFDNAPTVVVVIVVKNYKFLVVRRAIHPVGKLCFPCGYQMTGQTWQECGAAEVLEESGYVIDPKKIVQLGEIEHGSGGMNIIFSRYIDAEWDAENVGFTDDETQEVLWLDSVDENEWAFPIHVKHAKTIIQNDLW